MKNETSLTTTEAQPLLAIEDVVGITGTNGKTTCSYLLAQALSRLGMPTAVIGTLGYGFVNQLSYCGLTTPDAKALPQYMNELKAQGAMSIAMEVSSHGLVQDRVKDVSFKSAIFTNLTQDHMDYHKDMEAYGKAKQKLFQFPTLERAILNADSPYSEKIRRVMDRQVPVLHYSLHSQAQAGKVTVESSQITQRGIQASIQTPWGEGILRSTLLGQFNLSNLLAVLSELCLRGYALKEVLPVLSSVLPPPGRMQRLGGVVSPLVIIDYAHTPDALENALKTMRAYCQRRLWCVFGCGGDRDKDKRAKMGQVAGLLADRLVITNDNPRTEDPKSIVEDILQGVDIEYSHKVVIEQDRYKAIEYALNHALPVDTILIAGKGHEDYQIIGNKKMAFSDFMCVKTILGEK